MLLLLPPFSFLAHRAGAEFRAGVDLRQGDLLLLSFFSPPPSLFFFPEAEVAAWGSPLSRLPLREIFFFPPASQPAHTRRSPPRKDRVDLFFSLFFSPMIGLGDVSTISPFVMDLGRARPFPPPPFQELYGADQAAPSSSQTFLLGLSIVDAGSDPRQFSFFFPLPSLQRSGRSASSILLLAFKLSDRAIGPFPFFFFPSSLPLRPSPSSWRRCTAPGASLPLLPPWKRKVGFRTGKRKRSLRLSEWTHFASPLDSPKGEPGGLFGPSSPSFFFFLPSPRRRCWAFRSTAFSSRALSPSFFPSLPLRLRCRCRVFPLLSSEMEKDRKEGHPLLGLSRSLFFPPPPSYSRQAPRFRPSF